MVNISLWELFIILVVAVLVLGPKQLPVILSTVGRCIRWIRQSTESLKETIDQQIKMDELKRNQDRAQAAEENRYGKHQSQQPNGE